MDVRAGLVAGVLGLTVGASALALEPMYRVSGSGYIRVDLPGYLGESEFSYEQLLDADEVADGQIEFDVVTFSVNGVPMPGDGGGALTEYGDPGYLDAGMLYGPFEWGFREGEGIYFDANGVHCLFPEDWENPVCNAGDHDWNWESYVEEVLPLEVTLARSVVPGCLRTSGTITLFEPAPAGGVTLSLTDTLAAASTPADVTIPAGATTAKFVVQTVPVSTSQKGWVIATVEELDYLDSRAALEVRPIGVSSMKVKPTTVVGGLESEATVNLECKAEPGPITVDLGSSLPGVASPVAASIVVPQGVKSESFRIATTPVVSKQVAKISATANGIQKSKSLSVISAASVSATSLAFGNQPVNVPSAPLSVVLYNNGAVGFSVTGLTVTGTQPKMFVPTHNCPAILPAGGSCTIEVRFTPISTGKKAAQLNIATSAKDVPLVVKMTGTGV